MASTFTPNKGFELQATGENSGTWGTKANADFTQIDTSFGGRFNQSVAGNSNFTVSASQALNVRHVLTGALTGNINYILPNTGGYYLITNNTTGAFTLGISNAGGGSAVSLPRGGTGLFFVNPDTPGVDLAFGPQSADGRQFWGGTSTGTNAKAITVTEGFHTPTIGQMFTFLVNSTTTGAVTLNVNSTGAFNVLRLSGNTLTGGELSLNAPAHVIFDGAQFRLLSQQYQGGLINVRYFTTPGAVTYTPTTGTAKVRVRVVGGGGGGGGGQACNASQNACARSGGGGGYAEDFLTSGFAGVTLTVGAAGQGGNAGFNNGTTGGTSSFGSLVSATGGQGGTAGGAGAAPQGIGASSGGVGVAGSILASGGQSQGWALTALNVISQGSPGASPGYGQSITGRTSSGAGQVPGDYGCGGGGAVVTTSGSALAGGDGTAGLIIVEEYA